MLRLFLKKSYSLASNNRPLAAFQTLVPHFPPSFGPHTFSNDPILDNKAVFGNYIETRQFHVKLGKLEYRASVATQAKPALDDRWFDDEKASGEAAAGGGNEEGLEIAKIGISQEIVSALASRGITNLFPIQKAVLEPAMKGRDMFGRARTGTGKTLAFGIPIMNRIIEFNAKHGRGRNPLALVLAPTRELARQVEKEFHESAPNLDTICVYGGTPISKQMRELDYGVDIVVGTPGRIIDLIKRGSLNLSEVQFVVLDEADQMLSVGFVDDVETIFQRLPQNRQSMLFSATMPSWIKNLIRNYLKDPLTIDLVGDSDKKLADGITLYSIASDMYGKAAILGPLITEHAKGGKCIVFTQTKRDADRLANALARSSFKCEALHGDISQAVRERTLSGFRNGYFNVLVATDVAARGLDVPNVDLVIHYEIPNCPETFVHRSGRTGRAGKTGTAILIYTQDQTREVRNIQREVGCRFTELPRISSEGANTDMLNYMGYDGRPGSFGRDCSSRFSTFNRSDDYGSGGGSRNSRFGLSDGHNASGRFGYNRKPSGNFGGSGSWGGSGRPSAFEDFGSGRRSSFGDNSRQRNTFGDLGSGRSTGFDNYSSQNSDSRSGSYGAFGFGGNSKPASRFGNFGGGENENMKFSRTES